MFRGGGRAKNLGATANRLSISISASVIFSISGLVTYNYMVAASGHLTWHLFLFHITVDNFKTKFRDD